MKQVGKISILFFISMLVSQFILAQQISGSWVGALNFNGMSLPLVLNVTEQTGINLKATMDSPEQKAFDMEIDSAILKDSILTFEIRMLKVQFEGRIVAEDKIEGTFKQGGMEFPLLFKKGKYEEKKPNRPQDPKEPYGYFEEDVYFENTKDSIILTGTITIPSHAKNPPVVILISGSGPQDRNSEILNHRPFWVIADYLTKNGIAVLRYDERGVGQSTGKFSGATSFDFANDASVAVDYLKTRKDIDVNRIGLIGHSEGGIVAPLVASQRKDIAFMILLAAPGLRGDRLLLMQQEAISLAMGVNKDSVQETKRFNTGLYDIINAERDNKVLKEKMALYMENELSKIGVADAEERAKAIENLILTYNDKWLLTFMRHDPQAVLQKVTCPVLALNGSKDLQVPAKENLEAIKNALQTGGNKKVTIIELPGHNHLLQESETGLISEYGTIEQTFSPLALSKMLEWLNKQKGK